MRSYRNREFSGGSRNREDRHSRTACAFVLSLIIVITSVTEALSQTVTVQDIDRPGASLELLLPIFPSANSGSQSGMILGLAGKFRASETILLVVDLPYISYSSSQEYTTFGPTGPVTTSISSSSNAIGNVGVGADIRPSERFLIEIRLTLPTAPEGGDSRSARQMAYLADFDRFERYMPNVVTLMPAFNFVYSEEIGPLFRFRVAPLVYFPTEGTNRELEVFLNTGVGVGFKYQPVSFGVMFSLRSLLTAESAEPRHHFLFSAQYEFEFGTVGALYRIPDADIQNQITGTIGLTACFFLD